MKQKIVRGLIAMLSAALIGIGVCGSIGTVLPVYADEGELGGADGGWDDEEDDDEHYDDDRDNHRQEEWSDVPQQEEYYAYLYAHIHDNNITVGASTIAYVDVMTNGSQACLEVRWSSSNPSVATVSGNGNSAGVNGVGEGYSVITATLYMEGQYADSESVSVCVKKAQPSYVAVSGISISDTYVQMQSGESRKISAHPTPDNANNRGVTWSSTNTNVVQVDQDGTLHAVGGGQATVYAKTNENGYYVGCTVSVNGGGTAAVSGISVNPTAVTLAINQYMYITPTVYPSNAANKSVTWTSSNPAAATVSSDGKVMGKAPGQTVITCRTNDGGKTATTVVTVGTAVAGSGAAAQTAPVVANNTRSPQLCYQVVQQILGATPNATVTITTPQVMAYDVNVAAAMNMRPDVTLVCAFPFQGHNFTLTLPKGYGTKLNSHCDKQGYVEWLQLCALKDGPICRQLN